MTRAPLSFGDPCALFVARRVLAEGDVAVLPTESLYGFSVRGDSERALMRLRELKQRAAQQPFVGLVASLEVVESFVDRAVPAESMHFLRGAWPAPLTAVLPVAQAPPWGERLESGGTAAFRVPAHARLLELLRTVDAVVLSTSVNAAGEAPLRHIDAVAARYGAAAGVHLFRDRALERAAATAVAARPSTVANFGTWPPQVLRAGAFDLAAALARANAV